MTRATVRPTASLQTALLQTAVLQSGARLR
jgi:hypothetical protein